MRVLMFGWEFPPHFSGGLGVVCYELTKALSHMGVETTYVMPFGPDDMEAEYVDLKIGDRLADLEVDIKKVPSMLSPYATEESYKREYNQTESKLEGVSKDIYSPTLFQEVERFSQVGRALAIGEEHDVIHCHDWLTFPAGMKAKEVSGKPMVAHIHATEFDRTGDSGVNQKVYDIEREGMHKADMVITVSNKIKQRCIHQYGVPEEKIRVVYNAVNLSPTHVNANYEIKQDDKIILYVGRITLQKGPDYFIEAAKKVIEKDPNVKFIMAGSGDMLPQVIEKAAATGIGDKVIFPGFIPKEDVERLYKLADVLVMPSVSEPFGLVPLEAMVQETPVIISKQSGVSEVLKHCIKVDFWDTDKMAEKILAILHYRKLNNMLKQHGRMEVQQFDWKEPATQCLNIYEELQERVTI